ncbi:hypothetical protein GGR57DRAFT_248231 [Xylariaceae sp. FL1272]|nr:hypothetical protein GGR57DRAFT_248231 [Xylariaceae sp. FL1272]
MQVFNILLGTVLPFAATATENGRCSGTATGAYKSNGICIDTGKCASYGGSTITGGCPGDASNIKCCYILGCYDSTSSCRFTADGCSGPFVSGYCPGNSNYQCCNY